MNRKGEGSDSLPVVRRKGSESAGKWADESICPYGYGRSGASATARVARSEAERAEGGTSGTLVTEILGAPQRET